MSLTIDEAPTPETTAAFAHTHGGWFGHPRPLARLFATEMWERFGFYGMRALLTLYLTKHFVLGDRAATGLYGGYTALVYLTPLVGGLLADQYLGFKRAVKFGAVLLATGYLLLAAGGEPARPWAMIDGVKHPITVTHFRDAPTSAGDEERWLIDGAARLKLRGNEDGGIVLLASDGQAVRTLPKGALTEGADRNPAMIALMLAALSLIAIGNGFFKPNISTMVGQLYAPEDKRRDAGFTLFYFGINLGSTLGQFVCAVLADWLGWSAGFGIAGIGMVISLATITFDGGRLATLGNPPAREGPDRQWLIYGAALCAVPVLYWLYGNLMDAPEPAAGSGLIGYVLSLPLMGKLLFGTFLVSVPAILAWSYAKGSPQEFRMMAAAMVLITFNTVFWTLFEQAGSSLTLFADRNTDRSVFGLFSLSAPQTQNFNPLSIVFLAPVMSMLWSWLAKRGWEPSTPVKFAAALMGAGAGFLFLVAGSHFAGPDAKVGLGWLAGLYVLHSLAELCIAPVGLSMVTKLSIPRVVGLMMGVYFLSLSAAQYVAGAIAQVASVATVAGAVTNPRLSLETYTQVFTLIGWVAVGIGVLLLALARPLRRLMQGVS